jgi:polysaccharide export outer membrane protein
VGARKNYLSPRRRSYVLEPDLLRWSMSIKSISINQRITGYVAPGFVKTGLLAIVLGITLAGCSSVPTTPLNAPKQGVAISGSSSFAADINRNIAAAAMLSSSASSDYRLGPEDLVEITIFNIPEAVNAERGVTPRTNAVRVSEQGQVSLPLIGEVDVKGLTVTELEKKLREAYDKYIYNPQVGVLVREYRQRVSVIGSVQKPGVFELSGPKTVMAMLAMAGGVTDQAGTQVQVYRQGPNGRENYVIDLTVLASNASLINTKTEPLITMPVQSGDIINIPLAGTFFVDGAVKRPGSYPLGRRYSLMQALTAAGGLDRDLYSTDITIFRKKASGVEPIGIDLNNVIEGASVDPEIVPDDVILVPINTAKYVYFKIFGQILGWSTSIANTAAWAGS